MPFGLFWLPILLHTQNIKDFFLEYVGLTHENFISTKTEKHKLSFLGTKHIIKFISDMFYDRRDVYCKCFHLLFLIRWFFIKSKIEKRKIQFLLTKRGQKPYPICFLKPQSPILGGFICYFWFIAILLLQNLKNVKYRFWLQKGIKNWKWWIFLMSNFQNVRSFLL